MTDLRPLERRALALLLCHRGRASAITAKDAASHLGLGDGPSGRRRLQHLIEALRISGDPISQAYTSDEHGSNGYFYCATEAELDDYRSRALKRARREIFNAWRCTGSAACEKLLGEIDRQLELFGEGPHDL